MRYDSETDIGLIDTGHNPILWELFVLTPIDHRQLYTITMTTDTFNLSSFIIFRLTCPRLPACPMRAKNNDIHNI
jgi:hypothetical protein